MKIAVNLKQHVLKYQLSSNYQSFYIDVLVYDFRHDIRLKFDQKIIPGGGGKRPKSGLKLTRKKHHIKTHLILYSDLKF